MADFLLCPHMMEGAGDLSGASFIRALISLMKTLHSGPKNFPEFPPPNTEGGLRFQHVNLGVRGHKHSDHSSTLENF